MFFMVEHPSFAGSLEAPMTAIPLGWKMRLVAARICSVP
jgi:hypothetical protein